MSKEEYGVFSLVTVTYMVLSSISKFGLQHASLRFYYNEKNDLDRNKYFTTIFTSNLAISFAICFVIFLAISKYTRLIPSILNNFIIYIAVLGFVYNIISILLNIIRAEQNSKLYTVILIVQRYLKLLFAVVLFAVAYMRLKGILIGWILVDSSVLIFLTIYLLRRYRLSFRSYSTGSLKKYLSYGIPMIGFELSTLLLALGDRYLINYFMGSENVGIYSAGYNLSTYIANFFVSPLRLAIIPLYLKLWEKQGQRETEQFLNNALKLYLIISIPIFFGVIYFRNDLIIILASSKFAESASIIPYIVLSSLIYGPYFIYGAGFYIQKKSINLAIYTSLAVVLNIIVNIILIPLYGIKGAALATLIAYVFLFFAIFISSRKYITLSIPYISIMKYLLASTTMIFFVSFFSITGLFGILFKIVLASLFYATAVLLIDKQTRTHVFSFLKIKLVT